MVYFAAILSAFLSLISLVELRGVIALSSLDGRILTPNNPSAPTQAELFGLQQEAQRWFVPVASLATYSTALREAGLHEVSEAMRIRFFCASLSTLGQAIKSEPGKSSLLMSWANLRQLLGSVQCNDAFTSGSVDETVVLALRQAPYDPSARYAAGLISLWKGERQAAIEHFHEVLRFATSVSAGQERTMLSSLRTPTEVAALVPARFPQIVRWSELLTTHRDLPRTLRHEALHDQLALLQSQALVASAADFSAGAIPLSMHRDRLLKLEEVVHRSDVRQQLDRELARVFTRLSQPAAAQYFSRRAGLTSLTIISATEEGDTRATVTPLAHWQGADYLGSGSTVFLDDYYRTLGFFVAAHQGVSLIELRSESPTPFPIEQLKIYISDDNQNWESTTAEAQLSTLRIANSERVLIALTSDSHRYWKIHFASGVRSRTFGAPLESMLAVYGNSSRARSRPEIEHAAPVASPISEKQIMGPASSGAALTTGESN